MGSTGNKPYIIIGCAPRSASLFTCYTLRKLGLDVGHEAPAKDGVVGWQHLCPNHPWTMKALRKGRRRRKVYMMQTRHPVPAINSIAAMYFRGDWPPLAGGLSAGYICRMSASDTPVTKAMRLYYHLNALGMKDPKFRFRYQIENIDDEWRAIMKAVDMQGTAMPEITKDVNTRKGFGKYPELEWRDIYDAFPQYGDLIQQMAIEMGYDVGDWDGTELSQWADKQKGE